MPERKHSHAKTGPNRSTRRTTPPRGYLPGHPVSLMHRLFDLLEKSIRAGWGCWFRTYISILTIIGFPIFLAHGSSTTDVPREPPAYVVTCDGLPGQSHVVAPECGMPW